MTPDVRLKDYYLQFIYDAKVDIYKYKKQIEVAEQLRDSYIKYIEDNKEIIKSKCEIDLDKYTKEWGDKIYNDTESLYQYVLVKFRNNTIIEYKEYYIALIKYCNFLKNIYTYTKLMNLATKRKDMTISKYRSYIIMFYNKVHKCILEGNGYRFSYGIGIYVLNHWKLDINKLNNKPHIDFNETYKRKKELLAKGVKLYDDKEAAWYKARNIPYDAVDYRVYKRTTDWYEFRFINTRICDSNSLEYKRTDYLAKKYRGKGYKDLAEYCKSINDIYNLQVDIKYKLNILLYKDPTKYLNYVRNSTQKRYSH